MQKHEAKSDRICVMVPKLARAGMCITAAVNRVYFSILIFAM